MKIGVLGGTFDPIHVGHLVLGESAREQLDLERVLFVPTGHPWMKDDRLVTPAEKRAAMVRLSIEDNPAFHMSTIEMDRDGPSYTYETLEALQSEEPGAELYFILGSDAMADLPNWRCPERVIAAATLAVARRQDSGELELDSGVRELGPRVAEVSMPEIGISASEIRSRVARRVSVRYLIYPPVAEYIEREHLYSDFRKDAQ